MSILRPQSKRLFGGTDVCTYLSVQLIALGLVYAHAPRAKVAISS